MIAGVALIANNIQEWLTTWGNACIHFPTALKLRGHPSPVTPANNALSHQRAAQRERIEALRQAKRAARAASPSAGIVSPCISRLLRTACRRDRLPSGLMKHAVAQRAPIALAVQQNGVRHSAKTQCGRDVMLARPLAAASRPLYNPRKRNGDER
jgi:hypothetical protein